jgi:regulator of RNase E activity RraA
VIDMLGPSDIIVVDLFGKTDGGTGPDSLNNVMLTGINIPIRIGGATVVPGESGEYDGARRLDRVENGSPKIQIE